MWWGFWECPRQEETGAVNAPGLVAGAVWGVSGSCLAASPRPSAQEAAPAQLTPVCEGVLVQLVVPVVGVQRPVEHLRCRWCSACMCPAAHR